MSLTDPTASPPASVTDPADDVRERVTRDGVRYLFAQFVDLHAKPSAKLVPAPISRTCSPRAPASPGSPPGRSASAPTTRT